jgi:hypothetical protein
MTSPPEPAVDLPLWRLRKLAGRILRQLAGSPPPLPASCYPNIIPFPTGRHPRRPTRRR